VKKKKKHNGQSEFWKTDGWDEEKGVIFLPRWQKYYLKGKKIRCMEAHGKLDFLNNFIYQQPLDEKKKFIQWLSLPL